MCKSFKSGFEFAVSIDSNNLLFLKRKNGTSCFCPFSKDACCSDCPHFVIDNCDIVNKKCAINLTCGKHMMRIVEIL